MHAILTVLSMVVFAYLTYAQARRTKHWPWKVFFGIIGAIALFTGVFIIPVVYSPLLERHPNVFFPVFFGGLLVFSVAMIVVASRAVKKMTGENSTPTQTP
jgi:zinc transporter ZupT